MRIPFLLAACLGVTFLFGNQGDSLNDILDFAQRHQEFKDLYFRQNEENFATLVRKGQSPKILFIGCSDSRVTPDLILNARPGELFVIRTAGNFVPSYSPGMTDGVAASIQFAVEKLNVRHIVICGHSHCGAIEGLFQPLNPDQFGLVAKWLRWGEEAKQIVLKLANASTPKEKLYTLTEEISVIYQLEHLMTYPFIKESVQQGKIELHGWYFHIESGSLYYYDFKDYRFKPF